MSCHEVAGARRWLSRTAVVGLILISAGGVSSAATLEANIAAIFKALIHNLIRAFLCPPVSVSR